MFILFYRRVQLVGTAIRLGCSRNMISRFINHVLDNVYWIVCVCVQVPVGDFPRIGNKAAASPRYEVPSRHAGEVRLMDHASLNVTRLVGRGTAVVSGRKADGGRMRERERETEQRRWCMAGSVRPKVRVQESGSYSL